jgi:hypothetical protein
VIGVLLARCRVMRGVSQPKILRPNGFNDKKENRMDDFIAKWVAPYYMKILHGNYTSLKSLEQETFNRKVKEALPILNEIVVSRLLSGGWREQITGSWFCGLKRWNQFAEPIGKALVASEVTYAGQSHCFALASFADDVSVKYLMEYLDTYLSKLDCYYDQNWAMPALIWIDTKGNTNH